HCLPVAERFQTPLEQPLGLALLRGDEADGLFVQPRRRFVGFDVGDEAVLVLLVGDLFDRVAHCRFPTPVPRRALLSIIGEGTAPRTRSPSETCSNAPLIAWLMPDMKRREGQATRMAQVAWPRSSVDSHSTRSHGPSSTSSSAPSVTSSASPSNEYPPPTPRCDWTSPPLCRALSTFVTIGTGR